MRKTILAIAASLIVASPAVAQEMKMPMDHKGHGDMQHMEKMEHKDVAPGTEAEGTGILNSIDADKKQVNVSHDPMPALSWPSMTMALPVTSKVDLGSLKAGDKIAFKLKLGRDKTYRVIEITPAQ